MHVRVVHPAAKSRVVRPSRGERPYRVWDGQFATCTANSRIGPTQHETDPTPP
jgi:hypothetical protein